MPPEGYVEALSRADVVVSTAFHEFFGVAVVEAIAAGAFPILPNRLSYPELIPSAYNQTCLYDDDEALAVQLRWALTHRSEVRSVTAELAPTMSKFGWKTLGAVYDTRLAGLADTVGTGR